MLHRWKGPNIFLPMQTRNLYWMCCLNARASHDMMICSMKEYKHIYICHMYTTNVCTYTYAYGLSYDFYQTKEQLTNKIGSWVSRKATWHQVGDSARRRVCHQPHATFLATQPSMVTSEGMLRSITSPRPSCHIQKLKLRIVCSVPRMPTIQKTSIS